ncbi:SnoaL-like domain-containing protein [Massilia atriviolacea]|uniref:Nuclear transport factor 2 family protein n=1 Tax=Massilia atriviolacea TaxID=2495579 RepID=A0A430HIE8_9BURK|nr:nuclear transport factor 2 family protein [Massilia atriviolacea]RSZ57296.1 nuclear transport factor 2 family protein [Massilia atriviolacea]
MTLQLDTTIAAYFAAANAGRHEQLALCFEADAEVRDEGSTRQGRAAIAAWAGEAHRRYAAVSTPRAVAGSGADLIVTADVAGNFPGSPLPLHFHFRLGETGIAALSIKP